MQFKRKICYTLTYRSCATQAKTNFTPYNNNNRYIKVIFKKYMNKQYLLINDDLLIIKYDKLYKTIQKTIVKLPNV